MIRRPPRSTPGRTLFPYTTLSDLLTGCVTGLYGRVTGLYGRVTGLTGRVTGLTGCVDGLTGCVDDCAISDEDREKGIEINSLIEK
jgi:hypothetical protein